MAKLSKDEKIEIITLHSCGVGSRKIAERVLGSSSRKSTVNDYIKRFKSKRKSDLTKKSNEPKVLYIDIETAPVRAAVWSLWKQNVGLNQIENDWFILSYAAKWAGSDQVFYNDVSCYVDEEDDTELLEEMWNLLDQADVVVGHNVKKFDIKKINARFILNGYKPPSSYKQVDTLQIAKSKFAFTSNKLEYLSNMLCVEHKKLKHSKFAGYSLWAECLVDNPEAWAEMKAYNINDVLSLEEVYNKLKAWDSQHPNIANYTDLDQFVCNCGESDFKPSGYHHTQVSKFKKWQCNHCGAEYRELSNLFTKEQRKNIMVKL